MTSAQIRADEQTLVTDAVREVPLPDGVRFDRVIAGEDWTGEHSWHIYFEYPKSPDPTDSFINGLVDVRFAAMKRLSYVGTDMFAYIYFKEAK